MRISSAGRVQPGRVAVRQEAEETAPDPWSAFTSSISNHTCCAGHRNNDGCALCRQNHQRCEPGQSTGGAAHEIPGGVEYENGASARPDRLTDIACNIISAKQMVTVGLQYIGKHPESNSRPVAVVLPEAFEEAWPWPCSDM